MKISRYLKKPILIYLILLGYMKPQGLSAMSKYIGDFWTIIYNLFRLLTTTSFTLAFLLYFSRLKLRRSNVFFNLSCLYSFVLVLCEIHNGIESIVSTVWFSFSLLGLVMWIEIYSSRGYLNKFINGMANIGSVFIILNLITIIIFPEGMWVNVNGWWQNWIMGYKNNFIFQFIPYLALISIDSILRKGKITLYCYFIAFLMLVSSYVSDSVTSVIAMLAVCLALFIFENSILISKIKMWWIYLTSMLLSVLMIDLNLVNYFYDFISSKLNRTSTILGRVKIWDMGIDAFLSSPILGYGRKAYVDGGISVEITHYHNQYLDMLCVGGILLFAIWFFMIKSSSDLTDSKRVDFRIKNIILFTSCAYAILYLMEAQRTEVLAFAFLAIAYHCKTLKTTGYVSNLVHKKHPKYRVRV